MNNVLINSLLLGDKPGGVQYYIKNLFREFKEIKHPNLKCKALLTKSYVRNTGDAIGSEIEMPPVEIKGRVNRIIFEHFRIPKMYANGYDLIHSPAYILPYFWKKASVITVHDTITLDYPQLCQNETAIYFKALLSHSIKKTTQIITPSHKVKEDILQRFDVSEQKIHVVYHGVNKRFVKIEPNSQTAKRVRKKYNLPKRYILFVGNIEPKKNLDRLIRAFHLLRKSTNFEHKFVIVGKRAWKYKSVFKTISELKIQNEVICTEYIPESELPAIYSMADIFVFPSLYEGFGFPPLEAMACNVPVLVSNKGSLPEITGGKCIQVDPYNVKDIAGGIYKLLTEHSLRKQSIEEGRKWVKKYSWEKAAAETQKVYEKAINKIQ